MDTVTKIRKKNKQLEEEFKKIIEKEEPQNEVTVNPETNEVTIEQPEETVTEEQQEVEQPETYDEFEEEKWKHKYSVLQGKYNAEVPRLQQEVKKLQEEKAYLLTKVELLEKALNEQKAQPQVVEDQEEDSDIKTLKEDFPEIYNAIKKLLSKTVPPEVRNLTEEVKKQKMDNFYTSLKSLVPNWEEINVDEGFLKWLKEPEGFTGKTKHELLLEAYDQFDVNRVAAFFKAYISETSNSKPQQTHVAPQSRSLSTPSVNKRIYRQSQIEEFYRKKALGKIPAMEAERFEKEILSAMREGRIVID